MALGAYNGEMDMTPQQFLSELETGPYAWPGGYPRYFITADGEALSFKAADKNKERILDECLNLDRASWDEWKVVAVEINWEDANLFCVHSGERIESAYADDEA